MVKIGTILIEKQPGTLDQLHKNNKKKIKKERTEHLSFNDFKSMMESGPVYKRGRGGSFRQVRHK